MERSDWEKHKNYPPDWSWATWPERAGIVLVWIAGGAFGLAVAFGSVLVLGSVGVGLTRYHSEHNRCLQKATNGYEIERCH